MDKIIRSIKRDTCFIRAFANGHTGQIRDINTRGMKVALFGHPLIGKGDSINIKVVPDEETGLEPFYVRGRVMWVKGERRLVNFGIHYSDEGNMSVLRSLRKIIRTWR